MKKFKKIVNKKEIAVSYNDLFFNILGYWTLTHKKLESIVFDFEVKFSDYFKVKKSGKNIF